MKNDDIVLSYSFEINIYMKRIPGLWSMETSPLLQKRKNLCETVVQIIALIFTIGGTPLPTHLACYHQFSNQTGDYWITWIIHELPI